MNIQSDLVSRIKLLGEQVAKMEHSPGSGFRTALCDLIRDIPHDWQSSARELCLDENCPFGASVIEHLQQDIDTHVDDVNYTLIFYPLMRLAVAIRTAELRYSVQ